MKIAKNKITQKTGKEHELVILIGVDVQEKVPVHIKDINDMLVLDIISRLKEIIKLHHLLWVAFK